MHIPGIWLHTVEELQGLADQWRAQNDRSADALARFIKEEDEEGKETFIPEYLEEQEIKDKYRNHKSVFGPGFVIQNT